MSDYIKSTSFTPKDSLPSGDPNKVIKGVDFDTEFDAIETAVGTKTNKMATLSAGNLVTVSATGDVQASQTAALDVVYPVGSVYITTSASSPAVLFGAGTWVNIGEGRVLVGVGTGTDINGRTLTVLEGDTGGEYKHALTSAENGPHTHSITDSGHSHSVAAGGTDNSNINNADGTSDVDGSFSTGTSTTGITINSSGSGTAHNVTQPYLGVYMWERTV